MSPGIPPSLDRQDQRVVLVAGTIILGAMFVAILAVVVGRTAGGGVEDGSPTSRLDHYLAEEERASAYAALRDELDQMKDEPGITAVFCRDCSHQWVGGEIEFQGQVDFQMDSGVLERHNYTARLHGSRQDGWEVLSVALSLEEEL